MEQYQVSYIKNDGNVGLFKVGDDGTVKLGDFGLAIDTTRELPFSRSGTLDYMSPEVKWLRS